jgi:hypothetical protein
MTEKAEMPAEKMEQAVVGEAHRTRWGWVAYGYGEYIKLKRLHAIYFRALALAARWERWVRKAPHNRVLRRPLRDAARRRIGREVVGPLPEPRTCGTFTRRLVTADRKPVGRWFAGWAETSDRGVVAEYRKARSPKPSPGDVEPRGMGGPEIDAMLAEAEAWLASLQK